jgi:hypothetical protein
VNSVAGTVAPSGGPKASNHNKWKRPLAEMQGKDTYIRPKVVGPYASGSYEAPGCPFF